MYDFLSQQYWLLLGQQANEPAGPKGDTSETIQISALALLKMLKHGGLQFYSLIYLLVVLVPLFLLFYLSFSPLWVMKTPSKIQSNYFYQYWYCGSIKTKARRIICLLWFIRTCWSADGGHGPHAWGIRWWVHCAGCWCVRHATEWNWCLWGVVICIFLDFGIWSIAHFTH